jgi:hypothetical protein
MPPNAARLAAHREGGLTIRRRLAICPTRVFVPPSRKRLSTTDQGSSRGAGQCVRPVRPVSRFVRRVSREAVLRKDGRAVRVLPAGRPKVPVQEVPVVLPEPERDYCKDMPGMVYLDGINKSGSWVPERQARMFPTFDYLRDIIDSSPYGTVVLNGQRKSCSSTGRCMR